MKAVQLVRVCLVALNAGLYEAECQCMLSNSNILTDVFCLV